MKQLGKLFDEWKEQKEHEDAIEAAPSASGRFLIGRSEMAATPKTPRMPATPGRADGFHRLLRAGTRADGLVGGEIASSPVPEAEVDGMAAEGGSQSSGFSERYQAGMTTGNPDADRSKADRLFNVITNSKVRVDTFADRGHSDRASRQVPVEIEGFSHLKLVRLYQ